MNCDHTCDQYMNRLWFLHLILILTFLAKTSITFSFFCTIGLFITHKSLCIFIFFGLIHLFYKNLHFCCCYTFSFSRDFAFIHHFQILFSWWIQISLWEGLYTTWFSNPPKMGSPAGFIEFSNMIECLYIEVSQPRHNWHLELGNCCVWGCPVHLGMFNNMLVSTHQIPVAPTKSPPVVTTKNIFRHSETS